MSKISPVRRMRRYASRTSRMFPLVWYRHRRLRDLDVFLAPHPRSGDTCLFFLVCELSTGRDAAFEDGNRTVASVARSSEGRVSGSGGGATTFSHGLIFERTSLPDVCG